MSKLANAPKEIWDLWYKVEELYNGPGRQDEELSGIVGDRLHSFGFHLAPSELPSSDYSLQTAPDKQGARLYPNDASALDLHFGPSGMIAVTKRLIAAAERRDPAMDVLYEFCGTTNGYSPHPYTVYTHTNDPYNSQGWDVSHVTHVHLSFLRNKCHSADLLRLAYIIAGVEGDDMSAADVAAINKHTDAKVDALVKHVDTKLAGIEAGILAGVYGKLGLMFRGDATHPDNLKVLHEELDKLLAARGA